MTEIFGLLLLAAQSIWMQVCPLEAYPAALPIPMVREVATMHYGVQRIEDYENLKREVAFLNTSYDKTLEEYSRAVSFLKAYQPTGENLTIACLGDSITEGLNSGGGSINYPQVMESLLPGSTVLNYGIAGTCLTKIGDEYEPMNVRYRKVPADVDIIILFGGVNDAMHVEVEMFGNLDSRGQDTFCGQLEGLFWGLRENYPEAEIIVCTPLDSTIPELYRSWNPSLVPLSNYVAAVTYFANMYEMPVIDLYHSGLLNSFDETIVSTMMLDRIHPNDEGYEILGTYITAQVVKILQQKQYGE